MESTIKESDADSKEGPREWTQSASDVDARSVTSRVCIECTETLRKLLASLSARTDLPLSQVRSYKQSCRSFILWVDGYDVHIGGLDKPMNDSRVLRRPIHRLLAGLGTLVAESLVHVLGMSDTLHAEVTALKLIAAETKAELNNQHEQPPYAEDDDNESDEEDQDDSKEPSAQPNLEEALDHLANYVKRLIDLGPLIENPTPTPAASVKGKAPITTTTVAAIFGNLLQPFEDSIQQRFEKAPVFLVKRLARANLSRLSRLQGKRETALPATTDHGNIDETHTVSKPSQLDSGLRSSIATNSASTVMHHPWKDCDTVHIPPLPQAARSGGPFDCPACGKSIVMKTEKDWKRHLFEDLRPWVCVGPVNPKCDELFSSRHDWVQHLANTHLLERPLTTYTCPLCEEVITSGEDATIQHLASHLEEISLGALPPHVDDDESEEHTGHTSEGLHDIFGLSVDEWLGLSSPKHDSLISQDPWGAPENLEIPDSSIFSTTGELFLGNRPLINDNKPASMLLPGKRNQPRGALGNLGLPVPSVFSSTGGSFLRNTPLINYNTSAPLLLPDKGYQPWGPPENQDTPVPSIFSSTAGSLAGNTDLTSDDTSERLRPTGNRNQFAAPESSDAEDSLICDECGRNFNSHKALQRHRSTAARHQDSEDGVFICKCGSTTNRKDNFKTRHFKKCPRSQLHLPSDVFTCICNFKTASVQDMEQHFEACPKQRKHGRPKPRAIPTEDDGATH